MNGYRQAGFMNLTPVVKNLLIINIGMFVLENLLAEPLPGGGTTWRSLLSLHYFSNEDFYPFQLVTSMFMHSGLTHLFGNMLGLFFFGVTLENIWGSKRFLTYYMLTGVGAATLQLVVQGFQIYSMTGEFWITAESMVPTDVVKDVGRIYGSIMLGASGAVYGILMAFGLLFPNTLIYLYFAIPIKAKYLVLGLGIFALFSSIQNNPNDNVAHFVHLSGMGIGYLLLKLWKQDRSRFY